jgi:Uma2 family endonuclease
MIYQAGQRVPLFFGGDISVREIFEEKAGCATAVSRKIETGFPMATTDRLVTFAELEQMPDAPDGRYELRHGELVKVSHPELPHYRIQQRLLRLLMTIAGERGMVGTEFAFRGLPEHEYRIADVAFVAGDRWMRATGRYFEGAPEIVIEVLSPSNSASEMLDKEQLCLENGAKEFWVVDPERKHVRVSTADGRFAEYKAGQEIPLFFGGAIAVSEIFE